MIATMVLINVNINATVAMILDQSRHILADGESCVGVVLTHDGVP
jgi:hypothetical protein